MRQDNPRHSPIRISRYKEIHDSYMESFLNEHFISCHTLTFSANDPDEILLEGEIACLGNILITVDKTLEILQDYRKNALVQTVIYNYNVSVRGYGNVFRYDNSHARIGHPDNHHKHEFDWKLNDQDEGKVIWIGAEKWPTLGEVIEEARDWYWSNQSELPDGYPELGLY